MIVIVLIALWLSWSSKSREKPRWFLKLLVLSSPLGFIALEAGWMVTELGRQPWIVYGLMRTKDAVTPMPGIAVPFVLFTSLYILLAIVVVFLLATQMRHSPHVSFIHSGAGRMTDVG